ncbi:MAG: hypothetical protein ABI054_04335 [Planctomycetota bacterium]
MAIALILGAADVACGPPEPFVSKHVLELHADGSIHCDGLQIHVAGDDTRALRSHLHEVASEMPVAPIFPDHPAGPKSPNGRLDLRIDMVWPCSALLRAIEACMQPGIQIWNLRILTTTSGVAGRSISLELPRDIGASQCRSDIAGHPIRVRIRASSEPGGTARLAYTVSCPIDWGPDESDPSAIIYENHDARDSSDLKRKLAAQHVKWPERGVEMDPAADLRFAQLLETIDLGFQIGFSRVSIGLAEIKQ